MREQTPFFILSSGRTGSTFLARILNKHPDIIIVSDLFEPVGEEPYFRKDFVVSGVQFWDILKSPSFPQRIKSWRKKPNTELLFLHPEDDMVSLLLSYTIPFVSDKPMALFDYLAEHVQQFPEDNIQKQLIRFFELLRKWSGKKIWIERTGGSLPHTDKILELWPNAHVVYNYRDPRETAISMMRGSFFRLYHELEKNPELGEWEEAYFPPVEALGVMLNRWNVKADAALKKFQGKRMDLSYENLMQNPKENLEKLLVFFLQRTLDAKDKEWVENQVQTVRPSKLKFPNLPEDTRNRLADAVKESLLLLGYEK